MPYSYHKEGDKYVVTKKDTGKVVGHTAGTKEALKKYLAALHMNANEGKTNEASTLTKLARKIGWDKDWTPKEYAAQIKSLPDSTLISWTKNAIKHKGIPNTPLAFQQKLVKIEMAKRGLTLDEFNTTAMKKSDLRSMIQEIIKEVMNESYDYETQADLKAMAQSAESVRPEAQKHADILAKISNKDNLTKVAHEYFTKKGITDSDIISQAMDIAYSKLKESVDYNKFSTPSTDTIEKKKVQMLKPEDILTSGAKVLWVGQTAKTPTGKTRVDLEYPDGKKVTVYWGSNTIIGVKKNVSESVDYDTAVAYRLTVPGNRDEAIVSIKGLLDNLTIGKSKKFPEVKVVMLPSKNNPQDIILKLNGPGAFSMSKDIKARPELKGVKISKYTPQLTKIG